MKKLLILFTLVILLSCEKDKPPVECGTCWHVSMTINGDNITTQRWGEFTTCGDTLVNLNGATSLVHIDETGVDIIDVIICEKE